MNLILKGNGIFGSFLEYDFLAKLKLYLLKTDLLKPSILILDIRFMLGHDLDYGEISEKSWESR